MKQFLNARVEDVKKRPWFYANTLLLAGAMLSGTPAMAASVSSMVGQVLATIGSIAQFVGVIMFGWGLFQLILSFKDNNANAKTDASTLLIISVALVTFPNIITQVANAAGVNGIANGRSLIQ